MPAPSNFQQHTNNNGSLPNGNNGGLNNRDGSNDIIPWAGAMTTSTPQIGENLHGSSQVLQVFCLLSGLI